MVKGDHADRNARPCVMNGSSTAAGVRTPVWPLERISTISRTDWPSTDARLPAVRPADVVCRPVQQAACCLHATLCQYVEKRLTSRGTSRCYGLRWLVDGPGTWAPFETSKGTGPPRKGTLSPNAESREIRIYCVSTITSENYMGL